ncbi:uncharacterized protein LACBIDRAFT_313209 [Laccaria bicolor S238N-H82]|uniref:Predicted protein n=1 Tax=Laccaria bicolor (strain S238N-H82 / ATCC MYA-4686) TaxID=486041 RepID=B0DXS5_LACBS|nr:uncharacterized protein LACBIDRAFT_313209 [Laccaria bicolor S238N-H82]EDR00563.1 predicted protein [Laccaria bicolor S238N-H82]|eukprot:XP_001888790.1 predicted protein [Laccaria bicolor S238N-H82]
MGEKNRKIQSPTIPNVIQATTGQGRLRDRRDLGAWRPFDRSANESWRNLNGSGLAYGLWE